MGTIGLRVSDRGFLEWVQGNAESPSIAAEVARRMAKNRRLSRDAVLQQVLDDFCGGAPPRYPLEPLEGIRER